MSMPEGNAIMKGLAQLRNEAPPKPPVGNTLCLKEAQEIASPASETVGQTSTNPEGHTAGRREDENIREG
jgi:hypothetical protein